MPPNEPTHGDILRRIDGVEERLVGVEDRLMSVEENQAEAERRETVMNEHVVHIAEQAGRAAKVAEENREAFDRGMGQMMGVVSEHKDEFTKFRAHVEGAAMVIKWGLPIGMAAILALLGMAVT